MRSARGHLLAPLAVLMAAAGLAGCGSTSSSNFTGENKAVAESISSLASNATTANVKKICSEVLAASVKSRLAAHGSSCLKAFEEQIAEIDSYELTVESVSIHGLSATAHVKAIESGKNKEQTVYLVREGHDWKISGAS